jgi:multidrug efflux system membrane fusion protein
VRKIKPGPAEGLNTVVEEGLAPGEIVVVNGHDKLRDGAKVDTTQRDAADPAPGGTAKQGGGKKGDGKKGGGARRPQQEGAPPSDTK